ncbi:Adenylosuccinate synthetase [Borrelia miyamotoi]|nr:Adenylosuccinate synthetase [Borrelia miyamotoi]
MKHAINSGKSILIEGAQGMMLDIEHGTFPFVTSSNTLIVAATGCGIPISKITQRIGIVQAFSSRVGSEPFVTEISDPIGDKIREKGQEYGSTTKRPRRIGWIDLLTIKKSIYLNELNHLALTKLDILNDIEKLKICTAQHMNFKAKYMIIYPLLVKYLKKFNLYTKSLKDLKKTSKILAIMTICLLRLELTLNL